MDIENYSYTVSWTKLMWVSFFFFNYFETSVVFVKCIRHAAPEALKRGAVGCGLLQGSPGFHWDHQDFIGLTRISPGSLVRAEPGPVPLCDRDSCEHGGMRWQWCHEICWSPLRFSPHFVPVVEDLIWKSWCTLEIERTSNSPKDKIQDLDSEMQCADPTCAL